MRAIGPINIYFYTCMQICTQCQVLMEPNCFAVFVEHAKGKVWHPECFVCAQCKEQLLDHIYFWNDQEQKVYCGRHDAEKRRPRCTECDEVHVDIMYQTSSMNLLACSTELVHVSQKYHEKYHFIELV